MDQSISLPGIDRRRAVERLSAAIAASIDAARASEAPFFHLELDHVFPDDVYAAMLGGHAGRRRLPADVGPRERARRAPDGTHTRVKIDLFPEYIRHLPPEKRAVWDVVGRALCSAEVKAAFVRRLAPGLARRFGARLRAHRHVSGPDPDPRHSRLPHRSAHRHALERHHRAALSAARRLGHPCRHDLPRAACRTAACAKHTQMKFAPNTGYAFAVGDDTWHSADPVGPEVTTRDSILLTYFVDAGLLRLLRNRGKRIGNFLLNEWRSRVRVLVALARMEPPGRAEGAPGGKLRRMRDDLSRTSPALRASRAILQASTRH